MGEAKRRKALDPNYGKIPKNLPKFVKKVRNWANLAKKEPPYFSFCF